MSGLYCVRLCPIFLVSSVTGENLHSLKMFLNLLSTRVSFNNEDPAEFQIDDIYTVPVTILVHRYEILSMFFFQLLFLFLLIAGRRCSGIGYNFERSCSCK